MSSTTSLTSGARKLVAGWRWRLSYLIGTPVPHHFEPSLAAIVKRVRRDTLTSAERIAAVCDATSYIVRAGIDGAFAECGVWRGGSMMAVALTLIEHGETGRDLYLYDTFTGMTEPTAEDRSSPYDGYSPHRRWRRHRALRREWAGVPASVVRERIRSTGYPPERIHLIEGMVEDTLPAAGPDRIALLRLDTDWYASTKHELVSLYPRLAPGGVLIVDDYGHYEGARRAVDEYLSEAGEPLLLNRIDYTGRIAVKPPPSGTAGR
jgi:O-methyltransferase